MIPFVILLFTLALSLPLYAVPVTQTSSADTFVYDAVVVGTNNVVELIPANTGPPSPISTLTNVDIVTCAPGEICIEEFFTDSAGHIASSIVTEFSLLSTSIATAPEDNSRATKTSTVGSQTASTAMTSSVLVLPTSGSTSRGGTNESVSASGASSGQSILSAGTPSMQSAVPDVISSSSVCATISVVFTGTGATTSASTSNKGNNHVPALEGSAGQSSSSTSGTISVNSTGTGAMSSVTNSNIGNNPVPAFEGSSGRSALSTRTSPVRTDTSGEVSGPSKSTTSVSLTGTTTMISARNGSEGYGPPSSTYNTAFIMAGTSSATGQGLGSSNRTTSMTRTSPSPTGAVTYALEFTNSQGSVTDEIVEVGYYSGVASTNLLFAYADPITTTETSLPTGVSIQTITTSTCTTAAAIVTTTSFGSTVATEVPELCTHGFAFLIFGLPGFHLSSDLSSLCHKLFAFPLGITWRVFCPGGAPPIITITSVDPEELPPGDQPPGEDPPGENPKSDTPDDRNPTQTQRVSSATPSQMTQSQMMQSQTMQSQTQSTASSSAAATPTRYVVMPLMNTTQSATDSLFAPFAQRANVTQARRSDGSLDFFALELSDIEASTIDANPNFIVIEESGLDLGMPDTGQEDPDLLSTGYQMSPQDLDPKIGSRDIHHKDRGSKGGGIFRRIPLASWIERSASWTLALISLVPGLPLPAYKYGDDGDDGGTDYPYYYVDTVEPGTNVRVYLLDTGLNMLHPEFNGRLKPGITQGQTEDDWDIDWLFPEVDDKETFLARDFLARNVQQPYTYNYIDPNSPNPNGGIHPAYTDFRLDQPEYGKLTPHGTRVSAFILGEHLGQAQNCRFTVVKLPQYTNGPRAQTGVLFPLFSVRDALSKIAHDILERKEQGEKYFVVSSSCGYVFADNPGYNPTNREPRFIRMWQDYLNWFNANEVTISASAGNARNIHPEISLVPARLFKDPQIVVGSVTPNAMPHPLSQGEIGDGILTAYAPAAGALVVSDDGDGNYDYEWFDAPRSAVTSYGT